jgi:heme exporter protein C
MSPIGKALRLLLFAWIAGTIYAAFFLAPVAQGFAGLTGQAPESSRIVFFHVPVAVASFLAFVAAGVWSLLYLIRRRPQDDLSSHAAIEVGLLFSVLAVVTGAVWAKVQWGAYWNWDPRQTSVTLAILFYGAYLTLRSSIEDGETRARIAAAYSTLGLIVAPFLYFVMPRMAKFSLHPKPAGAEMDRTIGLIVVAGILGFTALFFWITALRRRILALEARAELDEIGGSK